jgi:hypothetical protein
MFYIVEDTYDRTSSINLACGEIEDDASENSDLISVQRHDHAEKNIIQA